jgi:hypothetical protein
MMRVQIVRCWFTLPTQFHTPSHSPRTSVAAQDDNGAADVDDGEVEDDAESEVGVGEEMSADLNLRIQKCRDALNDNSANLKAFIRRENKECMTAHKMKNPTKAPTNICKQWLQLHIVRLTKQLSVRFKTRLTARDRVMTTIRMLAILHHVSRCY